MPVILYKNCSIEDDVYSDVYNRVKDGNYDSFILIVPTRRKVRELQRELLRLAPNSTSPAFNLYTLETFAIRLCEIFLPPFTLLNATTQAVLFEQAIKNCRKDLSYFVSPTREGSIPKGTFQKIISVINKLKESGIYLSNLYTEIQSAENYERQKLTDILFIYQEYEKLLGTRFLDSAGLFKKLNELIFDQSTADKFFSVFPKVERLFITGFDEFKDPELTLIDNISTMGTDIKSFGTIISFDYQFDNDELFGHLKDNYEKFLKIGFKLYQRNENQEKDFKTYIIKNLFKENAVSINTAFREKVTLISSETRQQEVENVAKIIKYIKHCSPEKDLSKICISMMQPQLYTNLFHEIFSRYGIPANITDRFPLDQSPVVVSIISLLNVIQNNFMRRDLMRALASPYFTFHSGDSVIDAGNLISISAKLKISYGEKVWHEKIEKRINQIEIELKEVDDEITLYNYQKELQSLNKARNDIDAIINMIKKLAPESTPYDFRINLLNMLYSLKIEENILSYNFDNVELLEKDTRAFQNFLKMLDELVNLIIFENGDQHIFNIKYYIEKLKAAISQTRYNIKQKYGYGVYVTSFEETRGLEFDTMFIIGLVDGEFPQPYSPEIFFSRERQKLKEKYHLTEQRYLFYQCLTNFTDKLYLSYPKTDGEVELVKSPFIDAFCEIVELENFDNKMRTLVNEFEYCEEDLLTKIGFNLGVKPELIQPNVFEDRIRDTINFMAHSIYIEKQRYFGEKKFEYNGYISGQLSEEASKRLQSQKSNIYSVTQLEKYAKCPFSYFLSNLLKIEPMKELDEGITPLEKGSILHEILFEFYSKRRKNNLPLLAGCNETELQNALEEIINIAKSKLEIVETDDVLAFLDKELIIGSPGRKGLLEEFINYEQNRNVKIEPGFFEVAFGGEIGSSKSKDPEISTGKPIELGEYKIRGKIDRIDLGDNYFTIIDYKTGKQEVKLDDVEKGLALQLPIYLYAIEKILTEKMQREYTPAAAIYYYLSKGVNEKILVANKAYMEKAFPKTKQRNGLLQSDNEFRNIISLAISFVKNYIENIANGVFPLTIDENVDFACSYCVHDKVCRKQLFKEY